MRCGGGGGQKCYKCGKVGHIVRTCDQGGGYGGGVGYGGGGGGYGGGGDFEGGCGGRGGGAGGSTCQSCGGHGHMSRDCTQGQKCYNCDLAGPRLINAAGGEEGHLSRDCPSETSSERVCVKLGRIDGLQSPGNSPEANRWFLAQFEANLPQSLRGWLGAREPGVPYLPPDQDLLQPETPQRPVPFVPSSLALSSLRAPPGTCDPRLITSSPHEAGSSWMLGSSPEQHNALIEARNFIAQIISTCQYETTPVDIQS